VAKNSGPFAQVMQSAPGLLRVLGTGVLCAIPGVVQASCSLKPYDEGFQYSKAALETRDAFYAALCDESFTELIVLPDPRLDKRVVAPARLEPVGESANTSKVEESAVDRTTVLAYVVETNGSVDHAVVLESSGHRVLDEDAVTRTRKMRFVSPGKIDGLPVRVLLVGKVRFKIPANSTEAIPFSDEVITALGRRIIEYCNRGDVEGLYGEFDEAAKARTSIADIKQQIRLYNGLYGQMVLGKKRGRSDWNAHLDVPSYELLYDIALDRSGMEDVAMGVTLVARGVTPRVVEFWINRGLLVKRHRSERR